MKLAYCSDLHIEFGSITLNNTENADMLILAGDICVAKHNNYEFFEHISKEFPIVFYILGNHEYYHGSFNDTFYKLVEATEAFRNIHVVNNYYHKIDELKMAFATLWTDLESHPLAYINAKNGMNDFKVIHGLTRLSWNNAYEESLQFLKETVDSNTIVVTHHAPSFKSIAQHNWKSLVNRAYYSDLDRFILDKQPIAWIHGHTHHKNRYMIGKTMVLSNPRGYTGYEALADDFKLEHITYEIL